MVPYLYGWVNIIYVEFVVENSVVIVIKGFAEIYKQDSCIILVIISCFVDERFPEVQRLLSCPSQLQTDWNPHSDMFLSYGLQGTIPTF